MPHYTEGAIPTSPPRLWSGANHCRQRVTHCEPAQAVKTVPKEVRKALVPQKGPDLRPALIPKNHLLVIVRKAASFPALLASLPSQSTHSTVAATVRSTRACLCGETDPEMMEPSGVVTLPRMHEQRCGDVQPQGQAPTSHQHHTAVPASGVHGSQRSLCGRCCMRSALLK